MINTRALDVAVRRFPTLLTVARDSGCADVIAINAAIASRLHMIVAEYQMIMGPVIR
jgi:hypothetical protein